jgi:hypothetical protein
VSTEDLRNAFDEIKQDKTLGAPWQSNDLSLLDNPVFQDSVTAGENE